VNEKYSDDDVFFTAAACCELLEDERREGRSEVHHDAPRDLMAETLSRRTAKATTTEGPGTTVACTVGLCGLRTLVQPQPSRGS